MIATLRKFMEKRLGWRSAGGGGQLLGSWIGAEYSDENG
jgi:hypothetical protein